MSSLVFVGIGEVLYDVFEDGAETLGGAPLNVAVHAHQLAIQCRIGYGTVVSCINSDHRGYKILDALDRLKMPTRYIGRDSTHPTGAVSVFMRNGEPGYQIEAGAAWDYIADRPVLKELAGICDALCFGSLAQRSPVSRETIRKFIQYAPQAIRLYDVNLRRNTLTGEAHFSGEIVEAGCRAATIIKANQSELSAVLDLLGMDAHSDQNLTGVRRGMGKILTHFPVEAIVITRGALGSAALRRDGEFILSDPVAIAGIPYPVGAGDACSAGILFGMALGWDLRSSLELANRMGADAAAHPAATPPLSEKIWNFVNEKLQIKQDVLC